MFGGVYLPKFAHNNYGVTSEYINSIPRFRNSIPTDQNHELFIWSISKG